MSVDAESLFEPPVGSGVLQLDVFGGSTRTAAILVLEGYLAQAADQAATLADEAAQDQALRAYAYWQTYERRLEQLAGHGRGGITLAGQFSVNTTGEQIAELRRKAEYWRAEWLKLIPTEQAGSGTRTASRVTPNSATW